MACWCLTRDTFSVMTSVTIRELRNHGGNVVDRVVGGETLVITKSGKPVAELRPVRPRALDAESLLARWRHVPHVDPAALRHDLDSVLDASL